MACKVGEHPARPYLVLRLWWHNRETWEASGLTKTKTNREQLQRVADAVTGEIRNGQFTPERYLYYFPNGRRAEEFRPAVDSASRPPAKEQAASPEPLTVAAYYATWIAKYDLPSIRPSRRRDYRVHLVHYVLPHLGGKKLDALTMQDVEELRATLERGGLALKTIKNIVGSSLRALVRDAIRARVLTGDPFVGLEWERTISPRPDPFTPVERDKVLEWFATKRRWYYPFVFTLFHTGMRPSEATALRFDDLDLGRGMLDIKKSRHLGAEHPPKTTKSERTIKLPPAVVALLRELVPLHVDPSAYLFINAKNGGPIDQSEFAKTHWRTALRAAGVKIRKFYATRATFISITVPKTRTLKSLADYCGTSVAMIEKHYSRYMGDEPDWFGGAEETREFPHELAKPVTQARTSLVRAEKPLWNKASPTGFEPVLPT